ncbi:HNH endonuclease [Ideonella sp.]|uniref:HNH endonuclease n=1 Tax=Ideonella sp. TaxID=1929293 RepID=UPI0035AFEA02
MVVKRSQRARTNWCHPPEPPGPCPLCARPLVPGASVDEHHLVPRSQGGVAKEAVHRICHRKIHATFNEKELARNFHSWESLRAHPAIADFIRWVASKPPEFYRRNAASSQRR